MTLKKYEPQYIRKGTGRERRFEKLFLKNRISNRLISIAGKTLLTCLLWPRFVAPFRCKLNHFHMPLGDIPSSLAGYKILHLTDLHAGSVNPAYLRSVITRGLAEKPDVVVITGDLIDYGNKNDVHDLEPLLQQLLAAKIPDGIVAILGNHDYHEYSWRHNGPRSPHRAIHRSLLALLEKHNITLLRNQRHTITRNGTSLHFLGMDELWTRRADPTRAFAGLTPNDVTICLQHNPDGVVPLQPFPWRYMLCGHTHGGQANFPIVGPLFLPMEFPQYFRGFYYFAPLPGQPLQQRTMFVSTGIGYSHPIRLCCPPEISLFTITPGNAAQ